MKKFYDQKTVSKLIGISESQIRYWDKIGLIPRAGEEDGSPLFDFKGLAAFRTVRGLMEKGLSNRRIAKCMEKLKTIMPQIDQPLTELRITVHGKNMILGRDSLKFTPEGQLLIDFGKAAKSPPLLPADAEDLFFQALACAAENRLEEARRKYQAVLAQRPDHVDAMVNLGNIEHQLGACRVAEQYFRKALLIDPDHVEANFNLADILEERNELENAVLFYRKAIHEDPEFADAYFKLGIVLEKLGDIEEAKEQWWTYLDLDSSSRWADYVRSRLY
jgi:tetratricopeptide (TPR) repeat protein